MKDGHAVTISSPWIECRDGEVADQRVGAGAGGDVRRIDTVPLRERAAEVEGAAVGIAVERPRAPLHRLQGSREGLPRAFVRRELDDAIEPELALDLLLRLPGSYGTRPSRAARKSVTARSDFGYRRLVVRALAAPEPEHPDDCADAGRDRALVRALRPLDGAGNGAFALCFNTVFAPTQVSQPSTAYRLLNMLMPGG